MCEKNKTEKSGIKIIHKMADGTIRDSVNGYIVPYNEKTSVAYELLAKSIKRKE